MVRDVTGQLWSKILLFVAAITFDKYQYMYFILFFNTSILLLMIALKFSNVIFI